MVPPRLGRRVEWHLLMKKLNLKVDKWGVPKMLGFPNNHRENPSKNDQHLGCVKWGETHHEEGNTQIMFQTKMVNECRWRRHIKERKLNLLTLKKHTGVVNGG